MLRWLELSMPSEVIAFRLYPQAHMPTQLSSAGSYRMPTVCQARGLMQLEDGLDKPICVRFLALPFPGWD